MSAFDDFMISEAVGKNQQIQSLLTELNQVKAERDRLREQLKSAEEEIRDLTRPHLTWEEATS